MKYSLKTYVKAYTKFFFTTQFWGSAIYKAIPKTIRKYWLATALIEAHESGISVVKEEELVKAKNTVNQ